MTIPASSLPPPPGTFTSTTDSQGQPTEVPSVTGASLTDAQGVAIAAWLQAIDPGGLNFALFVPPFQTAIPGAAPGFNTRADQLVATYAQALQGNKLDPGAANSGLDVQNPLTSVEGFLSDLTNGKTWVRVAEFLVGGVMLAIAISALVKGTTGVSPSGAAKKVAKLNPGVRTASKVVNKTAPKPAAKSAPQYEGAHDRYVPQHGTDLSAPILG